MPKLNKLYQQNADKGLVVLGIAIDEEDDRLNKINKIIAKKNIAYPILLDALENPVWNQFKVKSIPAMFLIDPNGQIVQQWAGNFDDDEVVKSVQIFLSH